MEKNTVCLNCTIVPVPKHIALCVKCTEDLESWLFWQDFTEEQELSDYLDRLALEYEPAPTDLYFIPYKPI